MIKIEGSDFEIFIFKITAKKQTPGSYIIWEMQTWNDDQTLISEKKSK